MAWNADLDTALNAAFTLDEFERLIRFGVGKDYNVFEGSGAFPAIRMAVIVAAERDDWVRPLVTAALAAKPDSPQLRRFRREHPALSPALLKETDAALLAEGLESAFPAYDRLAPIVDDLGTKLDEIVGRVTGDPPPDYVRKLIAWFDARASIDRLMEACLDASNDPVLKVRAETVRENRGRQEAATGYKRPHPCDACMINGRVFLVRKGLRSAVKDLAPQPKKTIVAVNGPTRSGKSHSLELVRFAMGSLAPVEIAAVDLSQEQHALYQPQHLARSVMMQMGRSDRLQFLPKQEEASSPARWVRDLCDWISGEAKNGGKTWVIALDGFYHLGLPPLTREMVKELVQRAATANSFVRIVLLHYSEDLIPAGVRSRLAIEEIPAITDTLLSDYLRELFDQEGLSLDPSEIPEIVADIRQQVPNGDVSGIADAVQDWFDRVRASQGTAA